MRLIFMNLRACFLPALLAAAACLSVPAAHAQAIAGPANLADNFKDTSMLKLPPGSHAAIFEFEDLECPACGHAAPIVKAALDNYKIPFLRHDFIIPGHLWSRDAAITARYLQDKVSPELAEQYRRDVFASQISIASKDDLAQFTRKWFQQHGKQMPFVMDPSGVFNLEIEQDVNLANKLGLMRTPTIFVLAPKGWIQVTAIDQLYTAIDQALAQTPAKPAAKPSTTHKSASKAGL